MKTLKSIKIIIKILLEEIARKNLNIKVFFYLIKNLFINKKLCKFSDLI